MTKKLKTTVLTTLAAIGLAGCHSVELKDNLVGGPVYVPITTEGDWSLYGVGGALQSRRFIRQEQIPANYPYQEFCYTGFGGVLLVSTIHSDYRVYDLSCPVERSPNIRVAINADNFAVCPKCGSVYDVFELDAGPGHPISGPALDRGYALTPYRLLFNVDKRFALLSR